ncbi:MAG: LPP20 family lipoprotein, partial [Myxococcota bacterium]
IEQAIKTASSVSLRGTEIVDHYYEGSGTIYALAQLDIAKMNDALAAASESGAFKSYVTKVDTDDIFDQHGRKAEPPPPPPKVASDDRNAAPPAPEEAKQDEVPKAKSKPAWVDGDDPRFPREKYLCGVGFGPTRSHAENGSFAAISRVFEASVSSVAKDFMGAYQSTGAPDLEVQWTEQLTRVVTSKTLKGVEFRELWEDRKSGTYYGLACLDRAKAARDLIEQIATQDAETESALQRSRGTDKQTRFAMLAQALESVAKREALNAELRIVKFDGVGVPGPYSHGDVASAFSEAQEALLVGVQVEGPNADEFAAIFEERLTARGYKINIVEDGDFSGQDVVVKASVKFKKTGILDPNDPFYYAEGVAIINVINNSSGKKLKTITKRRKEGGRTRADAERKAVIKFAKAHAKDVGIAIDNAMKGK